MSEAIAAALEHELVLILGAELAHLIIIKVKAATKQTTP